MQLLIQEKNLFSHRKRDDAMKININKSLAVSEWENDTLEMTAVSRVDIGAYLCIASVSIQFFLMSIINYIVCLLFVICLLPCLIQKIRMEFLPL